ncbi:MAG: hypothetical protein HY820_13370 [Acidobacteria bacterium]|nr:hypothetical protein [Acidobacteriota bacterium]
MTKHLRIMFLGIAAATAAIASPINFFSQGTATDPNESNTMGNTVIVMKDPGWAAALAGSEWVSYGQTGNQYMPGYFMPANGTVVSFFELLTLPWIPSAAMVTYMADDSAALYINGVLVQPEAPVDNNSYRICSDYTPGCRTSTSVTLNIAPFLQAGDNTLRFDVAQRGSYSYGLNYAGFADGNVLPPPPDVTTPEPTTLVFTGCVLIGLGLLRRKR